MRLATRSILTLAAVAMLAGCVAPPAEDAVDPLDEIAALPGVVDVDPGGTESYVLVTMAADATDDEVLDAGTLIQRDATSAGWPGTVSLTRDLVDDFDKEHEVHLLAPWTVQVYPGEAADVAHQLSTALLVESAGDDANFSVDDGWPYLAITSLDRFAELFDRFHDAPLFRDGGTFTLFSDGHLNIVYVPARSSVESIHAIIQLAVDYPAAEILLQATTAGPQWPTLYVAHLTPDEVTQVEARLLDPELADADLEGYPMPFVLSTVGNDGPVYTYGNFGGVPD